MFGWLRRWWRGPEPVEPKRPQLTHVNDALLNIYASNVERSSGMRTLHLGYRAAERQRPMSRLPPRLYPQRPRRDESDTVTPLLMGYTLGQLSHHEPTPSTPAFEPGGGSFGGAGATGSWDSTPSTSSSCDSSSSSSADSGSSSAGSE